MLRFIILNKNVCIKNARENIVKKLRFKFITCKDAKSIHEMSIEGKSITKTYFIITNERAALRK